MEQFQTLPKLQAGDQVAVISPSQGLPEIFPWVQDLGLERLREVFKLKPKEYPTTRKMNSPLPDRARDLMEAFADPANKAIFTSIGGFDQIRLIKYLDPQVFLKNPKPFFGYSDNTHLHNFLWNLGIPSYYGGAVMTQLGMNKQMFDLTTSSLKRALFETGEFEMGIATKFNEEGLDWATEDNLKLPRKLEPNEGLFWDGDGEVTGTLWGGCVESLIAQATTQKYFPKTTDLENTILILETSEEIPAPWVVEYLLTGFGERGWFDRFKAVLVGRPKAWEFSKPNDIQTRNTYRKEQRKVILDTIRLYHPTIPVVQNLDFGHTDPQVILSLGQPARISTAEKKIWLQY